MTFSPLVSVIVTVDPDVVFEVLNRRNYAKAPYKSLEPLLGSTGLLISQHGHDWHRKRRIFNQGFKPEFLRDTISELVQGLCVEFCRILDQGVLDRDEFDHTLTFRYMLSGNPSPLQVEAHVKNVGQAASPKAIDLSHLFSSFALDLIGKAGFGHDFNFLQSNAKNINDIVSVCISEPSEKIRNPLREWTHPTETKAFEQGYQEFMDLGKDIVQECKRRQALGISSKKGGSIMDLMVRMGQDDEKDQMSDQELSDEVNSFLLAGHETTATTMTMCIMLLIQNPWYLEVVRKEVDQVLRDKLVPNFEDCLKLPWLTACIKETMRMYPVAQAAFRILTGDNVMIDGKKVDDGTPILIPYMSIHRDARLWGPASTYFCPERWVDCEPVVGDLRKLPKVYPVPKHTCAYLPFSNGPRICLGKDFAMLEMRMLLATVIHRYDFKYFRDPKGLPEAWTSGLKQGEDIIKAWQLWSVLDGEMLPYSEVLTLRLSESLVFFSRRVNGDSM